MVHCSLSRGYDIAASYRAQGFAATIECCIHYLVLDEENDVRRLGGKAKINQHGDVGVLACFQRAFVL